MKNENTEDTLILIPAYNEEKNLVFVIDNLKKYFNEILVVNDGSTDDTKLTLELKKINFINHAINLGQGAALETGFNYFIKNKKYKYIITFDADGQHSSLDAYNMMNLIKKNNNYQAVIGSRFKSKDSINQIPFFKKLTLIVAKFYERLFYGIKFSDAHNGLRVLKREIVEKKILPIESSGMNHATEISSKIMHSSMNFIEFPVNVKYKGKKSQNPLNAINILVNNIFYH